VFAQSYSSLIKLSMQKIACVFSFKMSSWVSCQKIVFNLVKAYQLNPDFELLNFNYSIDQDDQEIYQLAQKIAQSKPDVISVLDHKPHPAHLFVHLIKELKRLDRKPRFIFHIFGDFSLNYKFWGELGKILEGFEVDFVVASKRQKILIDKFLQPEHQSIVCPFPVDTKEFFYTPGLRIKQREDWGITDHDIAYVFCGRLSRQKRIHTLLKGFAELVESTQYPTSHLFIYGTPDNVGDQFVGIWEVEGEYFRKINRIYKSLSLEVQERIHFMGGVPNAELRAVYQGADWLVNLSVHNDEDYGMSVAEALCSGLPAIITDWGGLASFEISNIKNATFLIPTKIGQRSKIINYASFLNFLKLSLKNNSTEKRKEISKATIETFTIEPVSKVISDLLSTSPKPFVGFNQFFEKVLQNVTFFQTPYITTRKHINTTYREIYSSYVREN
jgi:glycosyltransferase involved in cell wall biosynthesis